MSAAEKSFFEVLKDVIKDEFYIFPQVELSRVLTIPDEELERISKDRKEERRLWLKYFNKIKGKSLDFIICDKLNISIQLIIELDDSSHNREDRKKRDEFVDEAITQAGIPILHVKAQYTYNPKELKKTLSKYLPDIEIINAPTTQTTPQNSPRKENICNSPGCNGTMKIRPDKTGKNYWVCSEYNKCKTAVAVEEAGA